jgi:hypothetical protein
MSTPDAIKYELGLTVIGLVVFWVWQTVTLRRDARKTAMEEEQAAQEKAGVGPQGPADTPPEP